jgi:hypothetical protein
MNTNMDFSETLIRCSSLGKIMTNPKDKADKEAGNLSETAKSHLVDVYIRFKYNRKSDFSNKYVEKGLMVEEDSITLYSLLKKNFFKKNEQHLKNKYIQGTPDIFEGESIETADVIIDIKSSWDIFTFFKNFGKPIDTDYYWQLQGYMALTGAKKAQLAYCLIDTPETLINDEKRKLMYKMNAVTDQNTDYIKACEELELNMKFGDIPMKNRLIEFEVPRNEEDIVRIYSKVKKCREFLTKLEQQLNA